MNWDRKKQSGTEWSVVGAPDCEWEAQALVPALRLAIGLAGLTFDLCRPSHPPLGAGGVGPGASKLVANGVRRVLWEELTGVLWGEMGGGLGVALDSS